MEKLNAADRLRIGQENIDRMKQEVEQTVSTVLGLVNRKRSQFFQAESDWSVVGLHKPCTLASHEFKWILRVNPRGVTADCWYLSEAGWGTSEMLVYSNYSAPKIPRLELVHLAHRARVLLVERVMENSYIAEIIQPILDAADYQF